MRKILIYSGGFLAIIWGIAHLIPTKSVVKGFGNISVDNVNIIRMEWINEGFTLIFLGSLTIITSMISDSDSKVVKTVYFLTFIMLSAMSILSLFTGFKIDYLPFKLCPVIFTAAGLLILQGAFARNK
jgi:hypothetical protein